MDCGRGTAFSYLDLAGMDTKDGKIVDIRLKTEFPISLVSMSAKAGGWEQERNFDSVSVICLRANAGGWEHR